MEHDEPDGGEISAIIGRGKWAEPFGEDSVWQMTYGERAALVGVLAELRPRVAIEIGVSRGGSLEAICKRARLVHAFDIEEPTVPLPENAVFHLGDSAEEVPRVLAELEQADQQVDFALVDGDHSTEGVVRDFEGLLGAPAVADCVILAHDTAYPGVRSGLEEIRFEAYPKVDYVDLDFVPGWTLPAPIYGSDQWGGFALVVVRADRLSYSGAPVRDRRRVDFDDVFAAAKTGQASRDRVEVLERELLDTRRTLDGLRAREEELRLHREREELLRLEAVTRAHDALLEELKSSTSWRVTAPLRLAKERLTTVEPAAPAAAGSPSSPSPGDPIDEANARVAERVRALESAQASLSWRVTSPIRAVGAGLRTLRRPGRPG